jgi:two-component system sensor histidine kinase RegB
VLDLRSLVRLRWAGAAVLGLVLLVGGTGVLPGPSLPVALGILVAASGLNATVATTGTRWVGPILIADIGLLTVLLGASGGLANPFTLLYLLPVVMGALVLPATWTVALAAISIGAFASLYLASNAHHHMDVSTHVIGMVAAYAITVPLLGFAVHRFRESAARAELEARRARASREASERLASLAALAGGAAHELATPLATIQMIASERLRALDDPDGALRSDLEEVLEEVETCRTVLDQLSIDAGGGRADAGVPVALDAFVAEAVGDGRPSAELDVEATTVVLPDRLVAQALRRLVGNARDATGPDGQVTVSARVEGDTVRFVVTDDGPGASPEVLARACEPFFTTKPASQGRGLGLFFVHSLAHQLGGTFTLRAGTDRGVVAELSLPGRATCASS